MNEKLYDAIKDTAEKINEADGFYGKLALRKVSAVNANSSLEVLVEVARDLDLIASKLID